MKPDFTARYNYNFPTSVRFGKGVIDELGKHLADKGLKRPLIVTDPGLVKLEVFQKVLGSLKAAGLTPEVFSGIDKNPVKSNVLKGADFYVSHKSDSIVGFGGGASMDVARAIALRINHTRDLFDYDDATGGDRFVTEEVPYFVTVPTTSGTGSEVGRSTVISDDVTHEKKILFSPKLLASKVFADPELTMGLPPFITAATGVDALTHNVEAYLAKGFSPLCDGIALEGIRLISQSLEKATNNPDIESRSKMMMASLMGATAFQKGLGVVHSLAHPLSTVVDMHHGLANAIMIPFGMEFNAEVAEERMRTMCEVVGLKERSPRSFITWLQELNAKIGIPKNLSSQKVTKEHLVRLSELAEKDPCHPSNPRPVTRADFLKIYEKALNA
ncbi:MAG TPA: iron-containing alcohol dehydrogenase [Bacteriovoracaceae bacterium]|nr:iron-containing alcohol dehydrogenase [Bacteriovoracaceae bacterium]